MTELNQKQKNDFLKIEKALYEPFNREALQLVAQFNTGLITWSELGRKLCAMDDNLKKALFAIRKAF